MHIENIVIETLEIKDHRPISCTVTGNIVITFEAIARRRLPCSCCGHRCVRHDRLKERTWLHVPLWGFAVFLVYRPWRVRCLSCGIKREAIPWAKGKKRMTTALSVTIATWVRLLPIETVGRIFGVHWNTIYAAVKDAVAYGISHRSHGTVLHIGIDEISRRKGHTYLTQVYDVQKRTLLWSGKDRKEDTLRAFFAAHPELAQTVTAVCCDMWAPFVTVIRECVPHAEIVFDKFHLIRHLLKAVDAVRIDETHEVKKTRPGVLAKTKYVLLKNEENLTEKQQVRLKDLQRRKLKSTRAWVLKEAFRDLWKCSSVGEAEGILRQWCWMAAHSRLTPIQKFVGMVRRHWSGILAYFKHRITNGVVEALNNTAKAISHRARGFRTADAFCQVMLLCMGGLSLPTLHHTFL